VTEELTLKVSGMTCGGCENAIRRVLSMVEGVNTAAASHKDAEVRVTYDPSRTDRRRIEQAIETAGYHVSL
jgi:copper chaperone CopZ